MIDENSVAIVTGANRGIGRAVVLGLVSRGFRVVICSRDHVLAEGIALSIGERALAINLDVTDDAACRSAISQVAQIWGRVNVLVNNAGVNEDGSHEVSELPLEVFDRTMRVNMRAPLVLSQLVLPHMKRAGWGRIVNISSGLSRMNTDTDEILAWSWSRMSAYRASKVGLNAITKSLAAGINPDEDVIINSVDPGWVRTRMGGPTAPRSAEEAADTIIWAACLPKGGPTGQMLKDHQISAF